MSLTKQEAIFILKEDLGRMAAKYPQFIKRTSFYISSHPDKEIALAQLLTKLYEIESYAEWILREELDTDKNELTNNRTTNER